MNETMIVVVEGWDQLTGWHFGGFYDLSCLEQKKRAKEVADELRKQYSHVRCRERYHGGCIVADKLMGD